jgi:6-phosphogluconolactonase (cycloisomerase 2 family)
MKPLNRLGAASLLAAALVAALAGPALADASHPAHNKDGLAGQAVFVQTDGTSGNQVVAYHRAADGTLTEIAAYSTGGLGGVLSGSVVDHLASQGSLALDPEAGLLLAVNAGSDSVSVLGVRGDHLRLQQVLGSGGTFPVSVAIRGDVAYVLNALKGGSVQGYHIGFDGVSPLPGSSRSLGLDPSATPQFTTTPGQVAFSPDGSQLIVTTKANGNDIDVFGVGRAGYLTQSPVINNEPGTVPFAIAYDQAGHLVIAEAGTNQLATFELHASGTITQLSAAGTAQAATCWVTSVGRLLFASNAGSATVTDFAAGAGGSLTSIGQTGTDPGTVDSAATPSGRFLYVQTGGQGIVDEYSIGAAGALTEIGSVTVPGAVGGEGIVAG